MLLRIAWRNLWRNPARTFIAASAIALAYSLYLMANGIQDYTFDEMKHAASKAAGGDVLVQMPTYLDTQMNDLVVQNGAAAVQAIRDVEGAEHVAPRVIITGLVSTSASSNAVSIRGIDPAAEKPIHDMSVYLVEGTWLDDSVQSPIVLGKGLAEELNAEIGDRIVVSANDTTGELTRALFHLGGVVATGSAMTDKQLAFTRVDLAAKAINAKDAYTQIGIVGRIPKEELARRVSTALKRPELQVAPWDVAMPDLVGFIEMKKGGGAFFGVLLFLVVLFSITNTFVMIVTERVREFGLLGALGITPRQAAAILLMETALLALVAMGIGLVLALAAHFTIAAYGIDMAALMGESMEVAGVSLTDTRIYSRVEPLRWASASFWVLIMVLLAAVYPAWVAARLQPVEAMRFYE